MITLLKVQKQKINLKKRKHSHQHLQLNTGCLPRKVYIVAQVHR